MTTKELIRAEIERIIRMNQTKRGFPAGTACAIRIEAYKRLLDFLDTLTDEPVGKTCKTCEFYENDCPFTRGKFMPYPNRVCKDYTCSTPKAEQKPESEDERIRKGLVKLMTVAGENYVMSATGFEKERFLAYLEKQKETPMPNSTELIEMWDKEKAMLKEKDFRDDVWRLAYNAFMDGFARGTYVKFEKQKE